MLSNKYLILALMATIIGCQNNIDEQLVQRNDYLPYLSTQKMFSVEQKLNTEIQFWDTRLREQPRSHLYLLKKAALLNAKFKLNGTIQDVHASDSILKLANDIVGGTDTGVFHRLATNAVIRHQFRQGLEFLKTAWKLGERKTTTLLMAVDVNLELGNYQEAQDLLSLVDNKSSFDYLIRLSKIKDHQGALPEAIKIMEKAFHRTLGNKELYCWALSNLADMYGHAGRVQESYHSYLKVLVKDPTYFYALRGIAWLAYAYDEDTTKANEILSFLKDKSQLPDQLLLEAEIAAFHGDETLNQRISEKFIQRASGSQYQGMYNKYLCLMATEAFEDHDRAILIAKKEIEQRPTPQSYDLLAWTLLQTGAVDEAFELAKNKVKDRSSEPEILYHLGAIYLAKGKRLQAKEFLEAALESSFELGPVISDRIRKMLDNIYTLPIT